MQQRQKQYQRLAVGSLLPENVLNYQNKDTITLFSHEWAMNGHRNILNRIKLRQSIKWLAKNNYKFSFLE